MRYVALLRGVNVGGKNPLPMAELRALLETLGHADVSTFIQSGNAVFSSPRAVTPKSLEAAIERQFGLRIPIVLRTASEFTAIVRDNPFASFDHTKLHVGFMTARPSTAAVAGLDPLQFEPEQFAVIGTEIYLALPNGMGRTKLPAYLDRQLKIPTTIRNWNTVTTLLELAHG